jgi:hypothetical protein
MTFTFFLNDRNYKEVFTSEPGRGIKREENDKENNEGIKWKESNHTT